MEDIDILKFNLQERQYPYFNDNELTMLLQNNDNNIKKASWKGCLLKANADDGISLDGALKTESNRIYWLGLAESYKSDYEKEGNGASGSGYKTSMIRNVGKIKAQAKKGISKKPTAIKLFRVVGGDDGMSEPNEIPLGELDVLFKDNIRSLTFNSSDNGISTRIRSLSILAVVDEFEIKSNDYFKIDGVKYKIVYPGEIIKGLYNSDIEVVK